jgi:hypothetical protein
METHSRPQELILYISSFRAISAVDGANTYREGHSVYGTPRATFHRQGSFTVADDALPRFRLGSARTRPPRPPVTLEG